jgi:hypothetical protein
VLARTLWQHPATYAGLLLALLDADDIQAVVVLPKTGHNAACMDISDIRGIS